MWKLGFYFKNCIFSSWRLANSDNSAEYIFVWSIYVFEIHLCLKYIPFRNTLHGKNTYITHNYIYEWRAPQLHPIVCLWKVGVCRYGTSCFIIPVLLYVTICFCLPTLTRNCFGSAPHLNTLHIVGLNWFDLFVFALHLMRFCDVYYVRMTRCLIL